MTLPAILGAALVLLICVGLAWSARFGPGRMPEGGAAAAPDGALHGQPEWWSDFERQFRAFAEGDGDRSASPRGRDPRSN